MQERHILKDVNEITVFDAGDDGNAYVQHLIWYRSFCLYRMRAAARKIIPPETSSLLENSCYLFKVQFQLTY